MCEIQGSDGEIKQLKINNNWVEFVKLVQIMQQQSWARASPKHFAIVKTRMVHVKRLSQLKAHLNADQILNFISIIFRSKSLRKVRQRGKQ